MVPSLKPAVAVYCKVWPVAMPALKGVTVTVLRVGGFTMIVAVAVKEFVVVAVTVAVPTPTAVTVSNPVLGAIPAESVTNFVFEEVHVTSVVSFCFPPSANVARASNCIVIPPFVIAHGWEAVQVAEVEVTMAILVGNGPVGVDWLPPRAISQPVMPTANTTINRQPNNLNRTEFLSISPNALIAQQPLATREGTLGGAI